MKPKFIFIILLFPFSILFLGCSNGVVVKVKLINALTSGPLSNASISIDGFGLLKTDDDGQLLLKNLDPYLEYNLLINPNNFTSTSVHFKTKGKDEQLELGQIFTVPTPPSRGEFIYKNDRYIELELVRAYRYFLYYGNPGEEPDGIAQSREGRFVGWYVTAKSLISVVKIMKGTPIVVWNTGGPSGNNYYCGIAPLIYKEKITITGEACGSKKQAIIPEGWYLGLTDLIIGKYNIYCYAPIEYSISKILFQELKCRVSDRLLVLSTDLTPGKYAFLTSDMDWDPSSSYASINGVRPNISSDVSVFEIVSD